MNKVSRRMIFMICITMRQIDHQSMAQFSYKEEQLNKNNMFYQRIQYQNNLSSCNSMYNQSQQFIQYQNNLEKEYIEAKQNVFGYYFLEIRDDNIPFFTTNQEINSQNNLQQKQATSACGIADSKIQTKTSKKNQYLKYSQKYTTCEVHERAFLQLFCYENESVEQLQKSKIVEKQEVQQKILFLENCIRDPSLFE
ncbi:hypothetical protein ABPG72_006701 [Tetrahymena utriculariae]